MSVRATGLDSLDLHKPDRERDGRARTVIVVAHPDDEVLGAGGSFDALGEITVVHVTNGAPRHPGAAAAHGFAALADYAAARKAEAVVALALAGLPATRLTGLGFADQEVAWNLLGVVRNIAPHLLGADRVLTHAFEGGHSDHDAVAYAVHACIRSASIERRPALIEMPFYYGDDLGWVRQRFLPHPGAGPEQAVELSDEQRTRKQRMIEAHRSQADTLRDFDMGLERFRLAPQYDFGQRPHAGPLLYERHDWNLTWTDWCTLMAAASAALGFDPR